MYLESFKLLILVGLALLMALLVVLLIKSLVERDIMRKARSMRENKKDNRSDNPIVSNETDIGMDGDNSSNKPVVDEVNYSFQSQKISFGFFTGLRFGLGFAFGVFLFSILVSILGVMLFGSIVSSKINTYTDPSNYIKLQAIDTPVPSGGINIFEMPQ